MWSFSQLNLGNSWDTVWKNQPFNHWSNIEYKCTHLWPKGSLRNESFWGFPWRLIELLDVRLWLYAAEKREFLQIVFFPSEIKKSGIFNRNKVFSSNLLLRHPQNQVNPLHVNRAATDWEWTPVWRGTGAALFLWVDPVIQQPLVSNGT